MIKQAGFILKNVFGYETFRPLQKEVIENVLWRRDTLAIMPTGSGKSLCYQIPALLFKGLTVVVSPLISLMTDQVQQLLEFGIRAVVLNSSLTYNEYQNNINQIMQNQARLLYVAPETLLMQKTLALLSSQQIDCLTIDEAHCISEWGHDFRPEYRQLAEIRKRFPKTVCIALTATATPRVQADIKKSLRFESSNEFIGSFDRKNLFLQIVPKKDSMRQTIEFLNKFPNQSGIIYCLSRRQTDETSEMLAKQGFSVRAYHAGLSDAERKENQTAFIRDNVQIMVATIAFGMGINKPNIRFILHYDLPQNIESYYQQIGRAGRDGLKAHCLLLFGYGDIQKIKYFIKQKEAQEQRVANIHLDALIGFAESYECRRMPLLKYFGENYTGGKCGMCDNCLAENQLEDVSIPAQKFLSCVKRCGEMFGAGHIIDVLRGSKSQKLLKYNHQKLSTYNIGREYSKSEWFYLSRQFLQQGLMIQDSDFGSLKLTEKAWQVFRGEEKVFVKLEKNYDNYDSPNDAENEYDLELFEKLKQKRKELADSANIPPYAIFPDKSLIEISAFFPQSLGSLVQIHGVGSIKLEKYGQIFLDLICEYCQSNGIKEKAKGIKNLVAGAVSRFSSKARHVIVGEAFSAEKSISELQTEFRIKQNTILSYLYKYITEVDAIQLSEERFSGLLGISGLSSEQQIQVFNIFDELGAELLKPVFEALNEQVSYDELHLLRLCYLMKMK